MFGNYLFCLTWQSFLEDYIKSTEKQREKQLAYYLNKYHVNKEKQIKIFRNKRKKTNVYR